MSKMAELDLLRFLETEADHALQHQEDNLESERARAMDEYLRQPYGNEEEGRSAVVSSDVFDAVEGMLPDLVEVFVASDKAVVFDPVSAEDEEGAEQATNSCNYVFYKQNNGFMVLYTAAKDALLLKTGGVKWYWENKRTPSFTTYKAVDEMQLAQFLMTNPKAEIVSQEEVEPTQEELQQHQAMQQEAMMMGVMPQEMPKRYTVKVKTVEQKGRVRVVNIPADELHVSARHNSLLLDECPYVAHVCEKTLSDVNEMGFDVTLDDIKAAQDEEGADRKSGWSREDNELDDSMVRGWMREEYVLVDFDGDGIAERRKIIRLGKLILENEECSHVPMAAWTPYILTHQFNGLSVADLVSDFQRIGTEILRQQLDNLYLANNQETVVLTDPQGNPLANIDDLLNRRPGGIMREQTAGAIRPYVERWQGIEAMPMVEMLGTAKENRTGWTRYSQGLDADSLNKTKGGMQMIMNASQKRMKLMARIMAEALVAPMMKGIFKTMTDYCMEEISFKLNNKFVKYSPQEWRDGYDMTINVGVGTGDVQQQNQFLMQMSQAQAMVAQSPLMGKLLTPKNIYNLQAKLAENAGFKNPGEYWTDPDTVEPPPPPPPNPQMLLDQAKVETEKVRTDNERIRTQVELAKAQKDLQPMPDSSGAELQQSHVKLDAEYRDREMREVLATQKDLERYRMQLESQRQMKAMDMNHETAGVMSTPDVMNPMMQMMQQLQNMMALNAAPKRIVRDENGRAIGVEPVMVGE